MVKVILIKLKFRSKTQWICFNLMHKMNWTVDIPILRWRVGCVSFTRRYWPSQCSQGEYFHSMYLETVSAFPFSNRWLHLKFIKHFYSCALFILVVSEVLHTEDVNTGPDLSGLHNVSQRSGEVEEKDTKSHADEPPDIQDIPKEAPEEPDQQMTFPDTLSVNSVTTDG